MMADLRGGFLLFVCVVFFLGILFLLAAGSIMRPNRWSERSRSAG